MYFLSRHKTTLKIIGYLFGRRLATVAFCTRIFVKLTDTHQSLLFFGIINGVFCIRRFTASKNNQNIDRVYNQPIANKSSSTPMR